ncbi:hypothetical protein [Streptomyces himalayensis]|uniref:Uncharacterized protein n=1 Tax=Streptomyces himalayensis subsp. himalayensis TaxID=2756131 RepID=A0A7W0DUA9_9ACTN|nr:hypothetical protein [Streptomyces himalayensis]MBA2951431.1 hypothetical protein [Streptomyces himalayensis subsp. himalayensis]
MAIRAAGGGGTGGEAAGADRFKSGTGATGGGAYVYMGQARGPATAVDERAGRAPRTSRAVWATEEEAYQDFFTWSQKQQSDFLAQGILSGQLKLGDGAMEASKLWKKLVQESARYGAAGKRVTPIDIMASYVSAAGGGKGSQWVQQGVFEVNTATGERRYVGPGKYLGDGKAQQTDTRVDLTDPDTARSVATQLFQNMMGRDPGAGELGAFASALHSAEQSNPVVQTTTTEYDMDTGQALSSSTQSSGGISAEGKAYIGEQQIKGKKEYGVHQAVTTYQNALESLIYGAPE